MPTSYLQITRCNRYEVWTLTRPERANAIGTTLAAELEEAVDRLAASQPPPSKPLVVTAKPVVKKDSRLWSAGGDLKELATIKNGEAAAGYGAALDRVAEKLSRLPVPVIVAVDGDAIGGGAEVAVMGDLRVIREGSRLIFKQMQIGLATGYGTTMRLCRLLGQSRAQQLLLHSRTLEAEEAVALGLFDTTIPQEDDLSTFLDDYCSVWEGIAPEALAAQKAMLHSAVREHPGSAPGRENDIFASVWGNPTHAEFLRKFSRRAKKSTETENE